MPDVCGKRNHKGEEYAEEDDLQGQVPTPEEAKIAADMTEEALAGLDETGVVTSVAEKPLEKRGI
jgi:hypothetical protein